MGDKQIQEQFGEKVIAAFADFARNDLQNTAELEAQSFAHITDVVLRRELAQVLYGARWIYKLGLALLTQDEERAAHVRAQIVDYASVCEALLSYCVLHALRNGHIKGEAYKWVDPDFKIKPITWNAATMQRTLMRQNMWWLIRVSRESSVINTGLEDDLNWLREQRNTVHLRQRVAVGPTAFLNQSKRAFGITLDLIQATKTWRAKAK